MWKIDCIALILLYKDKQTSDNKLTKPNIYWIFVSGYLNSKNTFKFVGKEN